MVSGTDSRDRVGERRGAVAIARHYRDEEGLSIARIARRLGRAEATVKAYLYDPSEANKRPTNTRKAGGREFRSHVQAAPSTVTDLYGTWAAALADAFGGA
jgi:predicted transcriptional regulator